jgi:DNA-binding response OmpR family regulator
MVATRILIVEDEPLIRMFVVDTLEDSGFQVAEADSAADAIAQLGGEEDFAAVIIDVGLPDRPGDGLADEARAKWPELPVVIASGRDRNELARRFSQDSRITVLGKPYTSHMLLNALRDLGVTAGTPE